ncbi:MAG: 1-acyl-sn-glycerol-3-phosphate acyltransferase, partial [Cyanobacteria bacterium J06632_3]
PITLKYRYRQPMQRVIDKTLQRLENQLNIAPANSDNYQRLRQIANEVILKIEKEADFLGLDLSNQEDLDWNQRIDRLRQVFIDKCESELGLKPNLNMPIRERVYRVQAFLEDSEDSKNKVDENTVDDSAETNSGMQSLSREDIYWDTVRLLNFDAIYDGYVAEAPTPERFLDTLTRLEREVFHLEHAQPKALRQACFYIGDPINLKAYLNDYQKDRSKTVDQLAAQLNQTMQDNLNKMNADKIK